jgi:hypothetical protein
MNGIFCAILRKANLTGEMFDIIQASLRFRKSDYNLRRSYWYGFVDD